MVCYVIGLVSNRIVILNGTLGCSRCRVGKWARCLGTKLTPEIEAKLKEQDMGDS